MPNESEIEAAARAMKQRHFEIYDRGYTAQNYFAEKAFLNAEKVVKRARKDARLALEAAEKVQAAEHARAMAGFDEKTLAELSGKTVS